MAVTIFAAYASPAKIAQIRAFGADVRLVDGPREASQDAAIRASGELYYASHNWQPFFLQGTKSIAYEMWEDFGFQAPDNVVIPAGAGSNVLGCAIGFAELLAAGQIRRLPRLFVAQPLHCSPVDASFQAARISWSSARCYPRWPRARPSANPAPARNAAGRASQRRADRGGDRGCDRGSRAQAGRDGALCRADQRDGRRRARHAGRARRHRATERTVVLLTGSGLKASQFMTELYS